MSHCSSQVAEARARYSALEEERETVFCFFVFHETSELQIKQAIASDGSPRIYTGCPIGITKTTNLGITISGKEQAFVGTAFKVAKNFDSCMVMSFSGFGHKLAQLLRSKGYVRPSDSKVNQVTN